MGHLRTNQSDPGHSPEYLALYCECCLVVFPLRYMEDERVVMALAVLLDVNVPADISSELASPFNYHQPLHPQWLLYWEYSCTCSDEVH